MTLRTRKVHRSSHGAAAWVTAMFTLSYCIFEVPTVTLGDRIGPRRVLTRIVLWWSAFTSLTGLASNYVVLLITRFCWLKVDAAKEVRKESAAVAVMV